MNGGQVRTDSFDFYEGIRIVIPGATAVAVLEATLHTISVNPSPDLLPSAVVAALVGLGFGFVLYFLDIPFKSAAFKNYLPTDLLIEWLPNKQKGKLRNLYFHILDTEVPSIIRTRALYMGSIFRIGFEVILLTAIGQLVLWSYIAISDAGTRLESNTLPTVGLSSLAILVVLRFTASLLIDVFKDRDRTAALRPSTLSVQSLRASSRVVVRQVRVDVGVVDRLVILVSIIVYAFGLLSSGESAEVVALVGALGIACEWLLHFVWGNRLLNPERSKPISPLTSLILYAGAVGSLIALATLREERIPVSHGVCVAWLAGAITTGVLIAARGHERRLRGAYTSQRTWLEMNKTQVLKLAKSI